MKQSELKKHLEELARVSNHYGANPDTVLAGGGNTSLKTDDTLYIKPSGTELATITADDFVALDRTSVRATLEKAYSVDPMSREAEVKADLLAARLPGQAGRPSVETALHEIFQGRFVVHIHPWLANTLACAKSGKAIAEELFGDGLLWIPYCDPGYTLATNVFRALEKYRAAHDGADPEVTLIQNHGPFFAADTAKAAQMRISQFLSKIVTYHEKQGPGALESETPNAIEEGRGALIAAIAPALRGMFADGARLPILRFDDSRLVMPFVATKKGAACLKGGPMTPDQIVYCKCFALWVSRAADAGKTIDKARAGLAAYREKWGYDPKVVAVEGLGIFAIGDTVRAAQNTLNVYRDALLIMRGAMAAGGVHAMTAKQYGFIDNWEVENYRRKIAASATAGRVAGKVAFVTGAAQGFGLEIAQHLADQGAVRDPGRHQCGRRRRGGCEDRGEVRQGRGDGNADRCDRSRVGGRRGRGDGARLWRAGRSGEQRGRSARREREDAAGEGFRFHDERELSWLFRVREILLPADGGAARRGTGGDGRHHPDQLEVGSGGQQQKLRVCGVRSSVGWD